jgi:four helix bundle protein
MVQSFRDLKVWHRAIEMSLAVYALTRSFPKEELYGLTSQMRRASVSIASNIAEGHARQSTGEYRQFLGIARGSNAELQTQMEIARSLGFGSPTQFSELEGLSFEVGKMLVGLLHAIGDQAKIRPA